MNSKTSEEGTPPARSSLEYGGSFNKALCTRLERHFSDAASDAEGQGKHAFVVGLFGEWGCGTLHLRHIQQHFDKRVEFKDTAPFLSHFFHPRKWSFRDRRGGSFSGVLVKPVTNHEMSVTG